MRDRETKDEGQKKFELIKGCAETARKNNWYNQLQHQRSNTKLIFIPFHPFPISPIQCLFISIHIIHIIFPFHLYFSLDVLERKNFSNLSKSHIQLCTTNITIMTFQLSKIWNIRSIYFLTNKYYCKMNYSPSDLSKRYWNIKMKTNSLFECQCYWR